jgi:hypothetical protein
MHVSGIWGIEDDDLVLQQLVIEDAPCLDRLLFLEGLHIGISVISAPRLHILGELQGRGHMLQFGTTTLQVCLGHIIYSNLYSSLLVAYDGSMHPCLVDQNVCKFYA